MEKYFAEKQYANSEYRWPCVHSYWKKLTIVKNSTVAGLSFFDNDVLQLHLLDGKPILCLALMKQRSLHYVYFPMARNRSHRPCWFSMELALPAITGECWCFTVTFYLARKQMLSGLLRFMSSVNPCRLKINYNDMKHLQEGKRVCVTQVARLAFYMTQFLQLSCKCILTDWNRSADLCNHCCDSGALEVFFCTSGALFSRSLLGVLHRGD